MEQIKNQIIINQNAKPAPHKRAFYVNETAKFLGKPFMQILGLTRTLTAEQISDLLLQAQSWNTAPQKLWWKLIKQKTYDKRNR